MGREVRRVPKDWVHPTDANERLIPLFELREPIESLQAAWDQRKTAHDEKEMCCTFEEWAGPRPMAEDYMPWWPDEEKTHYQMYETCTEGTPISPVMAMPETLANWLSISGASVFGGQPATFKEWFAIINTEQVMIPVAPGFFTCP